jgi:hypothetical protein
MPDLRTTVSELQTALGILGCHAPGHAPPGLHNVPADAWKATLKASESGDYQQLAACAWENGNAFFESSEGLRGRRPLAVEWKGPQKPPGYEYIPADLRVDHVYLISCKYRSQILLNTSPANLFDRSLQSRHGHSPVDWFAEVALAEYVALCEAALVELGCGDWPKDPRELTEAQRESLRSRLKGPWQGCLAGRFQQFSATVSEASVRRWKAQLGKKVLQETMTWRLLRLADAPYFVLGVDRFGQPIRVRIGTPWDWRQRYQFGQLEISAQPAGQPLVRWIAHAMDRETAQPVSVQGHIEIRWSHGKFNGSPEAKVYLDTPHHQTPGYFALT